MGGSGSKMLEKWIEDEITKYPEKYEMIKAIQHAFLKDKCFQVNVVAL